VANSARPHHVGGSGGTTWPEETIYSKVSTVGPDLHGEVPDPWIHRPDPSGGGGLGHSQQVPGFWEKEYLDLNQGQAGPGANTCPDHIVYASAPRSGGASMLPRGQLPVT
jgi:hypothetical protein